MGRQNSRGVYEFLPQFAGRLLRSIVSLRDAALTAFLVSLCDFKVPIVHDRLIISKLEKFSKAFDGEFRILDWSRFRMLVRLRRLFRSRRPLLFGLLCQNS